MTTDIETVEAEALTLPVTQRAVLAQHLLASLDDIDEQENERQWLDEANRRYNAYKSDGLASRDAFEAIAEMRGKI